MERTLARITPQQPGLRMRDPPMAHTRNIFAAGKSAVKNKLAIQRRPGVTIHLWNEVIYEPGSRDGSIDVPALGCPGSIQQPSYDCCLPPCLLGQDCASGAGIGRAIPYFVSAKFWMVDILLVYGGRRSRRQRTGSTVVFQQQTM